MSEDLNPKSAEAKQRKTPNWESVGAMAKSLNLPINPAERARDVSHMSASDLIALTTLMHSVIAPDTDANPTDYVLNMVSPTGQKRPLLPPEDRYTLFAHAAELIQELGARVPEGCEEDYLERASNVLALSTVIAHPFEDGNGATARAVSLIIREGFSTDEKYQSDLQALAINRPLGPDDLRIPSYLPQMSDANPRAVLSAAAALDVPLGPDLDAYRSATESLFTTPYE